MVALKTMLLACALGAADDTVLLDFTARWCGPCQQMKPTVHRLVGAGYPVQVVDIDQHPQLARQYGVRSFPCFVLVSGGREVTRAIGVQGYDDLVRMFAAAGYASPKQAADTAAPTVRAQSPDRLGDRLRQRVGNLFSPPANVPTPPKRPTPPPPRHEPPPARNASPPLPPVQSPGFSPDAEENRYQPLSVPAPSAAGGDDLAMRNLPTTFDDAVGGAAAKTAADKYSPQERALRASVRLTVESPSGNDIGSGTIIDTHGGEALVVTCGHIFRESAGKGPITVEFCGLSGAAPVQGKVISYDASKRDIALVAIRPPVEVEPVRVAPAGFLVGKRQPVFSVGCDNGGPARVVDSHVSGINRYLGPPNVEVAGQPTQGRSGGGLFNAEGQLIGICNAADPAEDEGIYAALSIVHDQLQQAGLRQLFAAVETTHSTPGAAPSPRDPETPGADRFAEAGSGTEVIFIVRPRDAAGRGEAITIRNPSPQLLELMRRELSQASAGGSRGGEYGGPIVRGQSGP
jgi:S1-C subfamily serine protease